MSLNPMAGGKTCKPILERDASSSLGVSDIEGSHPIFNWKSHKKRHRYASTVVAYFYRSWYAQDWRGEMLVLEVR